MELKTYVAQDSTGAVIPGAQATLYIDGTNDLATGLANADGEPIANPMVTNSGGAITFRAPNGIYQLQFNLGPILGTRFTIQFLDVTETIDQVEGIAEKAADLVEEAKTIYDADLYDTAFDALQDATLLPGKYFRVIGNAGQSAFNYYKKMSTTNYILMASIPTAQQVTTMNTAMTSKLEISVFNAVIQKQDPLTPASDVGYVVRDARGYQTWLAVSLVDGGPSKHAEDMIRSRLGMTVRTDFMADGEQIAWAVTDAAGNLTDLAIRRFDGQLADYAVRRIGSRILGEVNKTINAQLDPLKLTREPPGFQVLASIGRWGAMRGRGESVTSPINFVTPTNNQNARLTFANTPYSNDGPMLLIIYFGGVGSGPTLTPPPEYAAANNDGIIWARCNFEGDHYGSPKAMQDVADLYAQACKLAPVGGVMLLGNSMGGMGALNALLTGVVPGVLGLYLTDPVCNLWDRYNSTRQGLIQTAYGINANGIDYSTKTAGYDPVLRHWTDFRGAPVYCIASTGDNLVPITTNAQQLYDTFHQHLDFVLDVHTTDGHGAADRFDTTALRAFIRKITYGSILKS